MTSRRIGAMLEWSFPLYRLWGIEVRMHWFWPLLALAVLYTGKAWLALAAAGLIISLIQVLAHEYGHCWAARKVGGTADKILIWPLGGLSFVTAGDTTRSNMFVAFMGPAINALFIVGPAAVLAGLGKWQWDFLDPLHWAIPWPFTFAEQLLVITFKIALVLTLLNLVVPAYPLDGGRILLLWLADRYGRERGSRISLYFSIPVGLALSLWGMVTVELVLLLIGISVLFEAWQIRRLLEMGEISAHPAFASISDFGGMGYYREEAPRKPGFFERWRQRRAAEAQRRRHEEDALIRAKADQVLDKVAREGMHSLTPEERRILEEASRKMRGE